MYTYLTEWKTETKKWTLQVDIVSLLVGIWWGKPTNVSQVRKEELLLLIIYKLPLPQWDRERALYKIYETLFMVRKMENWKRYETSEKLQRANKLCMVQSGENISSFLYVYKIKLYTNQVRVKSLTLRFVNLRKVESM